MIDTSIITSSIYVLAKAALELFLIVYAIIAVVVIRQIKFMTTTIQSSTNKYLFILAYIHLFIILVVLLATLFIL